MHRVWNWLGVILACALLAGCQLAKYKGQAEASISASEATRLEVHAENGGITVRLGEGAEITIAAEIRAISQERADATSIRSDVSADGAIVIEPAWPDGKARSNESCSFTITVPRPMPVTLKTGNGAIEVASMSGAAIAHTSNGRIEITSHDGTVRATTSNGAIKLLNVTGSAECDTSNGSVRVELADANAGPVRIKTSNGAVELVVGSAFAGTLEASTSNGSMIATVPNARLTKSGEHSLRLEYSTPGGSSRITTSNGRVEIRSR